MGSLEQEQVLDSQLHAQTSASGLRDQHNRELENLTLTNQPLKTANFFFFAVIKCLKKLSLNTIAKCSCLVLISVLSASGILLLSFGRPNEETLQPVQELLSYLRFGLWWLALGVASSIGLGSGLHTFVLYLGPHIALFTLKSVSCGRVDLKSAPYDTIQLRSGPSWLDKSCSEYGPPLFSPPSARVPWTSILSQVQLEAILWGIGTALGELPPYFISRAAFISGNEREVVEDIDSASKEDSGIFSIHLKKMEQWLLSHKQYLNFFTILVLASVPNPLFDLAGIMCGQFGIPFWKFFTATLIGKAIIKTHIQSVFIISVCNNQLLDLIENQLVRVLTLIPGVASLLPNIISKLHIIREKYMAAPHPVSAVKAKKWDLSLGSLWNTIVWLMLLNFSAKIINATAKGYLREQQEKELAVLENSQVRG